MAFGDRSHAEGNCWWANGNNSHAEGDYTKAEGTASHAEGFTTIALVANSHAEGENTQANGAPSHAEGLFTISSSTASHAEGNATIALGAASHTEGYQTTASKQAAHAEGQITQAFGLWSHAEGINTIALGDDSHAEGSYTYATGVGAHTEGYITSGLDDWSHAEGIATLANYASHSEGHATSAWGEYSHAEGEYTQAIGQASHAEGTYSNLLSAVVPSWGSRAVGYASHAEGQSTQAMGVGSHTEGQGTSAYGAFNHAEGVQTMCTTPNYGLTGVHLSQGGHSEGYFTRVNAAYAGHAEGINTYAGADGAHTEGVLTSATGTYSHAAGILANAIHDNSWVWNGDSTKTITSEMSGQMKINSISGIRLQDTGTINFGGQNTAPIYPGYSNVVIALSSCTTGKRSYLNFEDAPTNQVAEFNIIQSISSNAILIDFDYGDYSKPMVNIRPDHSQPPLRIQWVPKEATFLPYNIGGFETYWPNTRIRFVQASAADYDNGYVHYFDTDGSFNVNGSVLPTVSGTYDLGSSARPWKDLWLSGASIHMDDNILSISAGSLTIANPTLSASTTIGAGELTFNNSTVVTDVTSTGLFMTLSVNGSAFAIPLYKY